MSLFANKYFYCQQLNFFISVSHAQMLAVGTKADRHNSINFVCTTILINSLDKIAIESIFAISHACEISFPR